MKLFYGVIPTLVILSVILISYPIESEAQQLESRYAFDIYLVFDEVNLDDAIQVKEAFKNKSETYPLKDHFRNWNHNTGKSLDGQRGLVSMSASFTFDEKDDCIAFYNWIITNMPPDIRDNIIYGRILVTDNTHHYPNDDILPDVIVFENTIGDETNAFFEY